MAKNLVIVESPAKAKTIKKYLGKDFDVKSSYGHIRDLSKKKMGVDIENNFKPDYIIDKDKSKLVKELKEAVKKSEMIWLASDEDREGEAIAWHLSEVLKLDEKNAKRIVFNEITKNAIQNAVKNPRWIDFNLVDAQQARRILDRLVGFELSELLWKKVKGAMSAGRVQSVAVRLVVEREREIQNFEKKSYFKITAYFIYKGKDKKEYKLKGDIITKIATEKEAKEILETLKESKFVVSNIEKKAIKRKPSAPFTTSTLQQEAHRKLGYSVSRTMMLAQKLYEEGKITYMRTDSVNLSEEAIEKCKSYILGKFGDKYLKIRKYKTKSKNAQEAHEAIRPTEMKINVTSDSAAQKLYELIFNRTLASQMADAVFDKTTITIKGDKCKHNLMAYAEVIKFKGFLEVYNYFERTDDEETQVLPKIDNGQVLDLLKSNAIQKYQNAPARFSEATLVKKLEEQGIGRPSTYAPIISTIQKRNYVIKTDIEGETVESVELILENSKISKKKKEDVWGRERNKFKPTDIGIVVTGFLEEHFKQIIDYSFTANVEQDFDKIAAGKADWTKIINKFYKDFHKIVSDRLENAEKVTGERLLGKDPESGKPVYAKLAKYGPVIQVGETNDENKPKYYSLNKNHSIETISLEEALEYLTTDQNGKYLGDDPKTGKPVYVRIGKYGPLAQIGTYENKEKPQFASLLKSQNIDTITLEDALKLFTLPRELGEYEGKKVKVAVGRFGPYILHNSKFTSLKKTDNPLEITLERAIELIEEKREADRKKLIKEFSEDFKVIKDRWGRPVIYFKKKYYKLPKDTDATKLTEKDCMKIIEEQS